MNHISASEQSTLTSALRSELQELETQLESVGRRNPSNPTDWEAEAPTDSVQPGDYNEQADKIEGYEENASILKELEIRYNSVKGALERLEQGTYGICEIGEPHPIELERLQANPAARTCMQHLEEQIF